jgi:type I restriction enzyme S subunit
MGAELPQGWLNVPLAQIAGINPRHPKGLADTLPVTFVPMAGLSESKPTFTFTEERPLGAVRKGFTHFAEGDVLFAKITPCTENGKGAVARGLRNQLGCGTTELHVVRPLADISPDYVYRFLAQPGIRRKAKDAFTGTAGQARVPTAFIQELEFPLAPLAEQRRIVAKLEMLLGKVDACKERLAKLSVLLKRFRQAVLAAACSGRLTADWREDAPPNSLLPLEPPNPGDMINVEEIVDVPGSWRWIPLQAVCDPGRSICYGVIKLGAETPNGIPCLRTSDVKPLAIDTTNVKRIAVAISDEYRRTLLRGGELLVNVRGTLGGVAVVPPAIRGCNVSREVAVVPVQGVLPRFVAFWIASVPCQNWLTGVAKGVAYTGINIADLKVLPVAIPSLAEQSEIVRRVDALFAVADQVQARFERARQQAEKLTPALLARAFRGELVPQDPNDEPASALLQRLRQEATRSHAKATQV